MNKPILLKVPKNFDGFDLEEFHSQCQAADHDNLVEYQSATRLHADLLKNAETLYGSSHEVTRLIRRRPPTRPASNEHRVYPKAERQFRAYQYGETRKAKQREGYRRRSDAAIAALNERGYHLGIDFSRSGAAQFLKRVQEHERTSASQ